MEGYMFIPNRCKKYKSDLFVTRIMGKKVVCMTGSDAAEIFYNNQLMTRKGALPKRIQKTLFGKNAIQTMDGISHRHRKRLFLSIMEIDKIEDLNRIMKKLWKSYAKTWSHNDTLILFDEAAAILCHGACIWSGIPIKKTDVKALAKDLTAMVDAFGAVGPRYYKGRLARIRTECKMKDIITKVRQQKIIVPYDSALFRIAFYRDPYGRLLDAKLAAIELINILRPITAIATYITFGALALYKYPRCKEKLVKGKLNYSHMFAQEIRRYFPFAPFLGAKVKNDFLYSKHYFKKGSLVFLDIYGSNHDRRIWEKPYRFNPSRFSFRDGNPYDFIPQGGGDLEKGHRCPGEWLTIMLLKTAMEFMAKNLSYNVPLQDLSYSLRRIPAIPKSRFIFNQIKYIP
jgi:fatty-acid peroxygenase